MHGLQITSWLSEKHYSKRHYWIGLNDLENENSFVWESGRVLSDEVKNHWANDQPNNQDDRDHCVQVYKNGSDRSEMWDTVCDKVLASVCQKRPPGKDDIFKYM